MTVHPHHLRRYVIERASGRTPRHEWAFYAPDLGVWVRTDETSAKRHEDYRRIRIDGLPWCNILGHCTEVADDDALQIYFMTVPPDDWRSLEIAVRQHPKRCLREWRAAGSRIIAAVSGATTTKTPGPLAGWPAARGTGQRSILPR